MFLVWIGAVLTTIIAGLELLTGVTDGGVSVGFSMAIAVWLWLTVIFANLAESIAEGRGKAQAESLRKTRTATSAIRVDGWDERNDPSAEHTTTTEVVSSELRYGDVVVVAAGQTILVTATSSGASLRSTNRPSPVSQPPWYGSPAATVLPSPVVRQCFRTVSSSKSPRSPGKVSSTA